MKHSNTLLITAYFPYLQNTEFGGRSWYLAEQKYLPSLRSIAKTKAPLFIWTQKEQFQESYHKLKEFVLPSSYIEAYSLFDSPLYSFIKELKVRKGINSQGNERSYDFCINKLLLIRDALVRFKDKEYCFFIDAGLSYHNNIPDQYFPHTQEEHNIARYAECSLFSPKLIDGLKKIADQNKIFTIMMTRPEHAIDLNELPEYVALKKTIIGGLFGGKRSMMLQWFNELIPFVVQHLKNNHLYLEEVYLSLFYLKHPTWFHVELFDLWWHSGFACDFARLPNGKVLPGRKFYTILEKLNGISNNDANDLDFLYDDTILVPNVSLS